jgi:hypothetical protein
MVKVKKNKPDSEAPNLRPIYILKNIVEKAPSALTTTLNKNFSIRGSCNFLKSFE